MTQAFNLAQLANNLNTSGQLDATDGLNGLVANANLASSGSASSSTYLRGDRVWASLPALGKVLQVVSVTKTDAFVGSTLTAWTDITGMSVSITPSSSTSKILVQVFMNGGSYDGIEKASWRLMRNSTAIDVGDAASNRPRATGDQGAPNQYWTAYTGAAYLDSPATTSALTYKCQYLASDSAQFWVNRTAADRDGTYLDSRTASTILVMEISA